MTEIYHTRTIHLSFLKQRNLDIRYPSRYCRLSPAACAKIFDAHTDEQLGASLFLKVVAKLRAMGKYIAGNAQYLPAM